MSGATLRRMGAITFAALTLLLVLMTFLPWAVWLGFAEANQPLIWPHITVGAFADYGTAVASWLRWTAPIVALAVIVTATVGPRVDAVIDRWLEAVMRRPGSIYAWTSAVVLAVGCVLLARFLFSFNPHLVDSIAQLFQARIFAGGSLTAPAPENIEFFGASHLIYQGERWFSQYPPGHPALLAVGLILGAPWLVNPLFAAGTALLLYAATRRLLGEGSARLAILLYLVSPFALFMSASYMNHVTTGFFLTLALYAAVRAVEGDGWRGWPFVVGIALGLAATIRPLDSVAWAVVLGIWILFRRGWKPAFAAGLTCVLALIPLLTYNALVMGHPLRFGYTLLWGPGHGLGFHPDPWGEPFTPIKSFAITALDFQRLNIALFQWPFPSLVFVFAALAVAALDPAFRKRSALLVALLLAAPAAYFFYWHRDNYLGPRFMYASLIPAILLTVVGIRGLDRHLGRWKGLARITLLIGLVFGLTVNVPETAGGIAGRLPGMKLHPEVDVERAGIGEAVVFVKVGWGNRLISRLWAWGVPASETERTFRVVDGCRLQLALDEADSLVTLGRDSADVLVRLRGRLEEWRDMDLRVVYERWPDPTIRYDTTLALPDRCDRQVRQDRTGFTLYGTHIWRNDPWLRRGTIYARYFEPERNRRLMARYPERDYYLYAPLSPEPGARPVLQRLIDRSPVVTPSPDAARGAEGSE